LDGDHDVIISQLPLKSSDLMVVPVFRESLSLVVASDHPLAGRGSVAESDLAGLRVLTLGPGYALNDLVSGVCAEFGADVLVNYQGTSLDALRQMIGMGMGAGFLPSLYVESEIRDSDPSVVVLPFRRGRFTRTIGLGWRRSTGRMRTIESVVQQVRGTIRVKFEGVVTAL
jgi:LysR family hydrogen peroxide-inducible transcriptional activator